jgi:hypothetical protein
MWRRFNFFERHALEPSELSGRGWVCGAAGTGGSAGAALLFFGGEDGTVAAADARLRPVAGWRAHDARCTHLVALTGQARTQPVVRPQRALPSEGFFESRCALTPRANR